MTTIQKRIVFLTMKLDLKAREYKELCLELDRIKNEEQVSNEELLELKSKFQKNHDEIVEINRELKGLKEKDNDLGNKSFKQEDLFKKGKKINNYEEKNKELLVKKDTNIIVRLIKKIKRLLKNS